MCMWQSIESSCLSAILNVCPFQCPHYNFQLFRNRVISPLQGNLFINLSMIMIKITLGVPTETVDFTTRLSTLIVYQSI